MVASLSSCHMLWFLDVAAGAGLIVDSYVDRASGVRGHDVAGKRLMTEVTLRPVTTFVGRQPIQAELEALHHEAHERCDMANSVKASIAVQASFG